MRQLVHNLGLIGFTVLAIIWLASAGWLIAAYFSRQSGADATDLSGDPDNPLLPLDSLSCPLIVSGQTQTIHTRFRGLESEAIPYSVEFSIIPSDVGASFQRLCSPDTLAGAGYAPDVACEFSPNALVAGATRSWFIYVFATPAEQVEGELIYLDATYAGRCFVRSADLLVADVFFTAALALTGLLVAVWGLTLWPVSGIAGRSLIAAAIIAIWIALSFGSGLAISGMAFPLGQIAGYFIVYALILGGLAGWWWLRHTPRRARPV